MRRFLSLLLMLAAVALTKSPAPALAGGAWRSVADGLELRDTAASEAAIQPSSPTVVSAARHGSPAPEPRSPRHVTPTGLTAPAGPTPAAASRTRSARVSQLATEFALAARGAHAPFFSTAPPPLA